MHPPSSALRALRAPTIRSRMSIGGSRHGSHGAPQWNEPTGYLFGEKPLPAGQKRQKEDWETIWMVGMFGSMAVAAIGLYYKPDTSVQSWALKEAKERLEARDEQYKYVAPQSNPPPS